MIGALVLLSTVSFQAKIFDNAEVKSRAIFSAKYVETVNDNGSDFQSDTQDRAGKTVFLEKMQLDPDGLLKFYQFQNLDQNLDGRLLAKKDHWEMRLKEGEAKRTRTFSKDEFEVLLVPPMIDDFIRQNWNELIEGKTFSFTLALTDRMMTLDFLVGVDKKTPKFITVEMKADNFFLRPFVPRVELTFSRDKRRISRFIGPSFLKRKTQDGGRKNFEMKTEYLF